MGKASKGNHIGFIMDLTEFSSELEKCQEQERLKGLSSIDLVKLREKLESERAAFLRSPPFIDFVLAMEERHGWRREEHCEP